MDLTRVGGGFEGGKKKVRALLRYCDRSPAGTFKPDEQEKTVTSRERPSRFTSLFAVHRLVWECGKDFQIPPEPERPTANAGAEETTASQSELKATVWEEGNGQRAKALAQPGHVTSRPEAGAGGGGHHF
ncbi:hypothetical protein GGP84_002961 [Salinibacter ruber]|nr:hypothetical protein [Salinibacter ruber]